MARGALLLLALGALGLSGALRLEEGGEGLERPRREAARSEKARAEKAAKAEKKRVGFGQRLRNFFKEEEEETTTPKPMYFGLPAYYEGHLPENYLNMTHMERQDFFFRMERWHDDTEEWKARQKCRGPRPGEKVVYFVTHGEAVPKEDDAPIWELGVNQAANVRHDPLFAKGLSGDPSYRVQAVLVSPARKAMQSAVVALGDVLPDASWEVETDVRGYGWVEGSLIPTLGATALLNLSSVQLYSRTASSLLSQYRELPKGWERATKPHKDRWFDFMDHMLERRETNFAIVTHGGMIKQANASKVHPGEVTVRALLPDRTWRRLSPSDCWARGE